MAGTDATKPPVAPGDPMYAAAAPTVTASLMPWQVEARLRCLDLARESARMQAVGDLKPIAEDYYRWVMGMPDPSPQPAQPEAAKEVGGKTQARA